MKTAKQEQIKVLRRQRHRLDCIAIQQHEHGDKSIAAEFSAASEELTTQIRFLQR